jgi:anti-sigma factor RsiW
MSAVREYHCIEFVEDVTAYVEGLLPADMVAIIDAHLDECPHCVEYLNEMKRTIRLTGHLAAASADTLAPETREALLRAFRDARGG